AFRTSTKTKALASKWPYRRDETPVFWSATMKRKFGILAAGFVLFCMTAPLVAHHSFEVEYDQKKPIEGKGADANGVVTTWNLELGRPNSSRLQMIHKDKGHGLEVPVPNR